MVLAPASHSTLVEPLPSQHGTQLTLTQKICWEEPGKQKTRSCRAQELARSSAQENARQKKGELPDSAIIALRKARKTATEKKES